MCRILSYGVQCYQMWRKLNNAIVFGNDCFASTIFNAIDVNKTTNILSILICCAKWLNCEWYSLSICGGWFLNDKKSLLLPSFRFNTSSDSFKSVFFCYHCFMWPFHVTVLCDRFIQTHHLRWNCLSMFDVLTFHSNFDDANLCV